MSYLSNVYRYSKEVGVNIDLDRVFKKDLLTIFID